MAAVPLNAAISSVASTTVALQTNQYAVISPVLPSLQATVTGVGGGGRGTVAVKLAAAKASFTGGIFSVTPTLPAVQASFSGSPALLATLTPKLPLLRMNATALPTGTGQMAARLAKPTAAMTGLPGRLAKMGVTLQPVQVQAQALLGSKASMGVNLKALKAALIGYASVQGTMKMMLPNLQVETTLEKILQQQIVYVLNTLTDTLTTYDSYPYNSFANIEGTYFAAGPGGIYRVEYADTDSGTPITSTLRFGQNDFKTEVIKRMEEIFIGMRSNDTVQLNVTVDENRNFPTYTYYIEPRGVEVLGNRRGLIGKGLRGRYWQFEFIMTAYFDFDTLHFLAVPSERRI